MVTRTRHNITLHVHRLFFCICLGEGGGVSSEQKAVSLCQQPPLLPAGIVVYTYIYVYVEKGNVMYTGFTKRLTLGGQSGVIEWTRTLTVKQGLEVYGWCKYSITSNFALILRVGAWVFKHCNDVLFIKFKPCLGFLISNTTSTLYNKLLERLRCEM